MSSKAALRIAIVGPLPPPSGGMATQTRQLKELLCAESIDAEVIQVNAPYRPAWIGNIRVVRALFRLIPYLADLSRAASRVDLFHVMANSGWAWHLCAAPAVWIARLYGKPVIVNYRGGGAEEFFASSIAKVKPTLLVAGLIVVPSGFLESVFARYGMATRVIPNVVDLARFSPAANAARNARATSPHLVVARNLEAMYDMPTAIRALALLRQRVPGARLTIAGSGPERSLLEALVRELGLASAVAFPGRLESEAMARLYRSADLMLNPSLVDNMPNSLLEALASGIPVVSTDVGGIRFLVDDGNTALLVPPGEPQAMAAAAERVLSEPGLAARLVRNGLAQVQRYAWPSVRELWLGAYRDVTASGATMSHSRGGGA